MTQFRPGRDVVVAGVGLHPFGRFPDKDLGSLALDAVVEALRDAGVRWKDIPIAYFGHVYYHGMSVGETTLSKLGLTGVPIINVENACSSGSTAFWQAYWGIAAGDLRHGLGLRRGEGAEGPGDRYRRRRSRTVHRRRPHDGRLRAAGPAVHGGDGRSGLRVGPSVGQSPAERRE